MIIKILRILLLIVLNISFNEIKTMEKQHINEEETQKNIDVIYDEFIKSIKGENFAQIQRVIEKIKANNMHLTSLASAKKNSLFYATLNRFLHTGSDFILTAIEYLIQDGFDINSKFTFNSGKFAPLEKALHFMAHTIFLDSSDPELVEESIQSYYKLIEVLLNYGANITEKAIYFAIISNYKNKMFQLFNAHKKLIDQAQTNPNSELLTEAISNNQPYIVQLIVQAKPELVTMEALKLARQTSLYSVKFLQPLLAIQKFEEAQLVQKCLPLKIMEHIKRFIDYKK